MNWKERYAELKVGDKVIMFKPCITCSSPGNTRPCWKKYFKDKKCEIDSIRESSNGRTHHIIRIGETIGCTINKECLKRL